MKVILLLNWGLGLEIIKTIQRLTDIKIVAVITQYNIAGNDKWISGNWPTFS